PITINVLLQLTNSITEIHYPPSLHDALPIRRRHPRLSRPQSRHRKGVEEESAFSAQPVINPDTPRTETGLMKLDPVTLEILGRKDRKSTRLNSSHVKTTYAVFCLKKKSYQKK